MRFGLWPSRYTSLISFLAYNFLFAGPFHTFTVAHEVELSTILFFLIVAVLVGNLAARLKAQVEAMRTTARRTANLFDFSRRIVAAASLDDVLWAAVHHVARSEEHTSELQSLMRISYAVFCLKKKKHK